MHQLPSAIRFTTPLIACEVHGRVGDRMQRALESLGDQITRILIHTTTLVPCVANKSAYVFVLCACARHTETTTALLRMTYSGCCAFGSSRKHPLGLTICTAATTGPVTLPAA